MKVGQVSLTQLKPMAATSPAMEPTGRLLRPSASIVSRCDGQFTHASFTRSPASSTIHRDAVDSVTASACRRRSAQWQAKPRDSHAVKTDEVSLILPNCSEWMDGGRGKTKEEWRYL